MIHIYIYKKNTAGFQEHSSERVLLILLRKVVLMVCNGGLIWVLLFLMVPY